MLSILRNVSKFSPLAPRRNILTVVYQGHEAYRLTLGKNPVKLNPGLHLKIPIIHRVIGVDTREQGINIEDINTYTKDNVPVSLNVTLFFKIENTYKACFNVSNYYDSVHNVGTSTIRSIIGTLEYDTIISDRNKINGLLTELISSSIAKWGVECTKAEIKSFSLNSESHLNIASNQAEAQFVLSKREADAKRYAIEQETIALSEQITEVAEKLNGDSELAARFLLSRRRFDELRAIANGPNNSVYFVNSEKEGYDGMKIFADFIKERP